MKKIANKISDFLDLFNLGLVDLYKKFIIWFIPMWFPILLFIFVIIYLIATLK